MNGIGIQLRLLGLLVIGTVCSFIACGGAGSPNPGLTPASAAPLTLNLDYVDTNGNDIVTATVSNHAASDTGMIWSVDNIPGGNETVGTISGTGTAGTYVAPTLPGLHTITAVSTADAKRVATAPVRVFAPAMEVALDPASGSLAPSGTLALTASVTGTRHTSVAWSVDGIAGGNASTGTITGSGSTVTYTAPASPGSHTIQATSSVNPQVFERAVLTVLAPGAVVVGVSPASASVQNGGTLSLTATVTGASNPAVTWDVDGIAGGNASTGTLTGSGSTVVYTAPGTAGTHTVRATSAEAPASSGAAAITVAPPVQVVLTPASASLSPGGTASITATVTGTGTTGVAWYVDGVPSGNATVGTITGTGNLVTYTAPAAAGSHTVSATSAADATRSASAVMTVLAPVQVSLSPSGGSLSTGATASVTATVTGTSNTAVTWTVDNIANGSTSVGTLTGTGNTRTYTAPAAAGTHTIVATSVADPTRSASGTVTVQSGVAVTLTPGSSSLATGAALSFTATVTGTTSTGVTWTVDDIAGGNATVGVISGTGATVTYTAPAAAGTHVVSARSAADTAKSASSTVTVTAGVTVALSPGATSMTGGTTKTFTATVTGTTATGVTWAVDDIAGGNATVGVISGTGTTATYTAPAAAGTHVVSARSTADTTRSASSTVTVTAGVTVALSPGATSMTGGATKTFTATVTGSTAGVTWNVDNVPGGNATTGTLSGTGTTVTYTAPLAAGTHTILAQSVEDTTRNASATVTVTAPAVVLVLSPAATASVATSGSLSFTATVTGASETGVTWTVDAIAGGNATVGTLSGTGATVTYAAPASAGTHTVKATSVADPTKSSSTVVTVAAPGATTAIELTPGTPTAIGSGGQLTFSAAITGSTTDSVTWSVDGIAGGNSTVGTISSAGVYTCPAASAKAIRRITATSVSTPSVSASVRILTVASNTTVNARTQYGAAGDGTTDDTAAINRALAATGSGICYVPAGTYLINPVASSSQFGLYLNSGNTLLLDPGAVLQCKTMTIGSGYALVGMRESNIALVGGTLIGDRVARNLPTYINGVGSDMEVGNGVSIGTASGITLLGVTSKNNCNDGFYIYSNVSGVVISDCTADNNRRQGCSLVYCNGVVIQYSTFSNTNGNDPACGLDFEPNSGSTVKNVQVIGCNIFGNAGGGIAGGGSTKNGPTGNGTAFCTDCVVTGCTITDNGGSNYHLGGIAWDESERISFTNNTIRNNKGDGIWIDYYAMDFVITGNTVTGNQGDGIYLSYCTGTVVNGNTVLGNTGTAIRNADGSATVGTNTTK